MTIDPCEGLGPVEAEYAPSGGNLTAGHLVAVLLIGAGGGLLYLMLRHIVGSGGHLPWIAGPHRLSWFSATLAIALGAGLLGSGARIYRRVASLGLLEVAVCARGLCYRDGEQSESFPWTDIDVVEEFMVHQRPAPTGRAARRGLSRRTTSRLLIRRRDGREARFDANSIGDMVSLEATLRQRCQQHDITWKVVPTDHQ